MQTYSKHLGYKSYRGGAATKGLKAIKAHVKYIENRQDEQGEKVQRELFGKEGQIKRQDFYKTLNEQKRQGVIAHKLVISMGRNDYEAQKIDLKQLAKDTMSGYEARAGRQFNWIACVHEKNSNPHVHIVVAGRDTQGREVTFMPKQLQNFKNIADKEREVQADRNLERNDVPYLENNPFKQIESEKTITPSVPGLGLAKALIKITKELNYSAKKGRQGSQEKLKKKSKGKDYENDYDRER